MGVRVNLPPGCEGLNMEDGTRYTARRKGGQVEVAERHASALNRLKTGGDAGLVSGKEKTVLATKGGRVCPVCARRWQAWTEVCHSCGAITVPE